MVSSSRKLCENVSCSYPGIVRGRTTAEYEPCKDNREDIVEACCTQLTYKRFVPRR